MAAKIKKSRATPALYVVRSQFLPHERQPTSRDTRDVTRSTELAQYFDGGFYEPKGGFNTHLTQRWSGPLMHIFSKATFLRGR